MPTIQVDQDLINEILRLKQLIKSSVDGVMDGSLTAGHLASDVYMLLDMLDRLGGASGLQPIQEAAPMVATQPEQTVQEAPPAEEPSSEKPAQEPAQTEQSQSE